MKTNHSWKALLVLLLLIFSCTNSIAQEEKSTSVTSPEQKQRLEKMKSKGVDGSLTILPAVLMGKPEVRLSEILGALLEKQGLKNIELGNNELIPGKNLTLDSLAGLASTFVKNYPPATDYVLYAEMIVDREKKAITNVIGIVLDKTGAIVWKENLSQKDESFKKVEDPDPFGYSILLMQTLSPLMGLNEETARNAKPGKMAAIMDERSGLPPEEERSPMQARQKIMKQNFSGSTLIVFPVRVDFQSSPESAADLTKMINEAKLCRATALKDPILMKSAPETPNEMKKLWDLAREFRDYVKQNPQKADYVLYADYNPPGYVHFIVCDQTGEWVITDLRNSTFQDFRAFNTMTAEGCNKLLVNRLKSYVSTSVAKVIGETIKTSGLEAAQTKFKDIRSNMAGYYLSEEEMNALGYEYLGAKKVAEAIEVFKMNVEAFPESFNTYDSLGEAYAAAGENEKAIKYYEKSLELNPASPSGIDALKKLKK